MKLSSYSCVSEWRACLLVSVLCVAMSHVHAKPKICGEQYHDLEYNLVSNQKNIEILKSTFFPENNVAPLQIIISYRVSDNSTYLNYSVWAWMWNPVYMFCGSRFLAEVGLGIPVISLKHAMANFSKPFIKVKEIDLFLSNLTQQTAQKACIGKLTSLLKEFTKHGSDTTSVQVANAVFSLPYSRRLDLANTTNQDGPDVWILHVTATVYAVLLSIFLLPLCYYIVMEHYSRVVGMVRNPESACYAVFWATFTFCLLSNFYHTVSYMYIWGHNISWAYAVFGESTRVYHCLWWTSATLLQGIAAAVFPKQGEFPFPRVFSLFCCCMKRERMNSVVQSLVMFVFLYFVHVQAQSAMFMALAVVADPVTATTWIISTLFLRVAVVAFLASLFSIDRLCSVHDEVRLSPMRAAKDCFHLFSWGVPFLGACLLVGGFSGLTFMDKDTQPKYVSSIASFLLAPPILAFLGWLSRFFIRKLFFMVSSGYAPLANRDGYTPITNDDVVFLDSE